MTFSRSISDGGASTIPVGRNVSSKKITQSTHRLNISRSESPGFVLGEFIEPDSKETRWGLSDLKLLPGVMAASQVEGIVSRYLNDNFETAYNFSKV